MTEADHDPAAHYDRVTDAWRLLLGEELHYGVFDDADDPLPVATAALTARMVDAAELAAGQRVLDVGCGTGAPACALVEAHGVEVLGITTSEVGVARARERAAARGSGRRPPSSSGTAPTTACPTPASTASGCSSRRT